MTEIEIKKGLAGVTVDYTAVSKVNPETNSLLYRGYPVQELAATQSFEAVAYLLWNGDLPTDEQLADFVAEERANRTLDENVREAIDLVPLDAHPMDVLRTAVSLVGASDPAAFDNSRGVRPREVACGCSRSCRRWSRTTSAAATAWGSSTRATTSTIRRTSSG